MDALVIRFLGVSAALSTHLYPLPDGGWRPIH